MGRKSLAGLAALAVVSLAGPSEAAAESPLWLQNVCGGSTFTSCIEFSLEKDASATDLYYFNVRYASSLAADPGVVKEVGIYDLTGDPVFDFTDVTLLSPANWLAWDTHYINEKDKEITDNCVQGGGLDGIFEACAERDGSADDGLHVGEAVRFSFRSATAISTADFASTGGLGARAHLQSFGTPDCSFKYDTRTGVWGDGYTVDGCGGSDVVPEPITFALMGTGLLALWGVAAVRRREDEDEV